MLLLVAAAFSLAGCTVGGSRSASAENDLLRRERLELKQELDRLQRDNADLKAKLAAASGPRPAGLDAEALAALPVCASIEIDGLSGWTPVSPAEPARGVAVYVRPLDARARFVQAVGVIEVEAISVPSMSMGGQPRRVAGAVLGPPMVREAYRSGFMGTNYTIDLVFDAPIDRTADPGASLLLRARYIDALTGRSHETERTLPAYRPADARETSPSAPALHGNNRP